MDGSGPMNSLARLAPFKIGDRPFCLKCKRAVDSTSIEMEIKNHFGWGGTTITGHTGKVTITVQCHGETWKEIRYV